MLLSPGIPWVRIGLLAILILTIGATGFETGRRWVLSDWNAEKAAQAQAERDAAQEAQRLAARLTTISQGVQDEYAAQARKERGAADHARAAAGRLYDDLAAAQREADDSDSACGSDAETTALRQLFGACSGQYRDMAAEAGSFAGQLSALQVWTAGVCAPAVTTDGARGER